MKKTSQKDRKQGQALVEYIIIVVIVAIAAIAVVGVFSDTVQNIFNGATEELGGTAATNTDGVSKLQELGGGN